MNNVARINLFHLPRIIKLLFCAVMVLSSTQLRAEGHWESVFDFQLKVATMGSVAGQFRVAEMYEEGRGVERDLQKAIIWYEKAALQNHQEAKRRIEAIRAGNPRPAFVDTSSPQPAPVEEAKPDRSDESLKMQQQMEALQQERERLEAEKKRIAQARAQLQKEREQQSREEIAAEEMKKRIRAEEAIKEMMAVPSAMEE